MARLSFALLASATATFAAAQVGTQSALPEVSAPSGAACGGCYVIADVAGIVFGGVVTSTATAIQSVGLNGTALSPATATVGQGVFSFTPGGVIGAGPTVFNSFGVPVVVAGATLTSPTSYEVFSAYSVTSYVSSGGSCVTSAGTPIVLSSAYKFAIASNADSGVLLQGEDAFISSLGLTCSAGGGNVQSTVHSVVSVTTTTATTSGLLRPTPQAASTASATVASSTAATTTSSSSSSIAASTTVVVVNGTGAASGSGATFTIFPYTGAAADLAPTAIGGPIALACGLAVWLI